jgi:tetratricopeptide (TPR) repeat protein
VIEQAWTAMQGYEELTPEFRSYVNYYCGAFACYFATIGQPEKAAEFAHRATLAAEHARNQVESAGALQCLAIVRLRLGDEVGYREVCGKLVQLAPNIVDDGLRLNCIRVPNLGPHAVDPDLLVKLAKEFAANNSLRTPDIDLRVLGVAHFRAGDYEEAAKCLEQSIAQRPSGAPPSHGPDFGELLLAMIKWQQGAHDEARRMLRELQPRIEERLRSPWLYWDHRAVLEIRWREAEAMIKPKVADEAVENNSQINDEPPAGK